MIYDASGPANDDHPTMSLECSSAYETAHSRPHLLYLGSIYPIASRSTQPPQMMIRQLADASNEIPTLGSLMYE